jgi:6-phosphogluconolactonase
MTPSRDVQTFDDLALLSTAAAAEVVRIARESVTARGRFTVALAGGNTPRPAYELLATRHRDDVDWHRTVIVFGDERFVPPDDPRSNYRMAREALLDRVPIPPERVYPVATDVPSVHEAADRYDRVLRETLGEPGVAAAGTHSHSASATVDVALLGVGPDGHTASLFPGAPTLRERTRWAVSVNAPSHIQPAVPRISTTLEFLDRARVVIFLVAGADKRVVIGEILGGGEAARRYPAALVAPRGRAIWMIDQSAMPDGRSNA